MNEKKKHNNKRNRTQLLVICSFYYFRKQCKTNKKKTTYERERIRSLTKYGEQQKTPKIHRTNFPYYLTSETQCNRLNIFCTLTTIRRIFFFALRDFDLRVFFHTRLPFRYLILLLFGCALSSLCESNTLRGFFARVNVV